MNGSIKVIAASVIVLLAGCARSPSQSGGSSADCNQNAYLMKYDCSISKIQSAAENGSADAQYALGYMYYYGIDAVRDEDTATLWIKRAAAQGQPLAKKALQLINAGQDFDKTTSTRSSLIRQQPPEDVSSMNQEKPSAPIKNSLPNYNSKQPGNGQQALPASAPTPPPPPPSNANGQQPSPAASAPTPPPPSNANGQQPPPPAGSSPSAPSTPGLGQSSTPTPSTPGLLPQTSTPATPGLGQSTSTSTTNTPGLGQSTSTSTTNTPGLGQSTSVSSTPGIGQTSSVGGSGSAPSSVPNAPGLQQTSPVGSAPSGAPAPGSTPPPTSVPPPPDSVPNVPKKSSLQQLNAYSITDARLAAYAKPNTSASAASAHNRGGNYTLQLMGTYDLAYLKHVRAAMHLGSKVHTARAEFHGKPWYILTYGRYPTTMQAHAAEKRLPEAVQKMHPWVKSYPTA